MTKVDNNPQVLTFKKTTITVTPNEGEEINPAEIKKLIKDIKQGNFAPNFGLDFDLLQKSNHETAKLNQSKNKNRSNIAKKAVVQAGVFAGAVVLGQEAVKMAKGIAQKGLKQSLNALKQSGEGIVNNQVRPVINQTFKKATGILPKISTPAKVIIAAGSALIAGKALYKAGRAEGVNLSEKSRQQQSVADHINNNFS